MGMSDERKKQRAIKKAAKEARMRGEKPTSPHLTGNWGQRMRKLREQPPIQPTPHSRGWSLALEVGS